MKKIIAFLLLLGSVTCSAQEKIVPTPMTKSDYLAKAKRQNTTGWVLLGTEGITTTIGLILVSNRAWNELEASFNHSNSDGGFVAGIVLTLTGVGMMGGSIPPLHCRLQEQANGSDDECLLQDRRILPAAA